MDPLVLLDTPVNMLKLFIQHPKVQDVLSETVEYLIFQGKFTLLDALLPALDLSQYFDDVVDSRPTILAKHPSLLFKCWKKRRERQVIVNNFASIFSYFQCSNYDVALDLLERMNKKERQAQRDWVLQQCNEFHLALFLRHNLFQEYGLDILNTHLESHHHNIVLKCLKVDPDFISKEMDLQRFSLELIEYGQYYLLADLIKVLKMKAITAIATSPRNYLRFLYKHCLPLGSKTNYLGTQDSKFYIRAQYQEKSLNYLLDTIGTLFPEIDYFRRNSELLQSYKNNSSKMIAQTVKKYAKMYKKRVDKEEKDTKDDKFEQAEQVLSEIHCDKLSKRRRWPRRYRRYYWNQYW